MGALPSRFKQALAKLSGEKKGKLSERIALVSSAGAAISVIFAGLKYVFGFFTPVGLEIALPPLIEFRCSSTDFDAKACVRGAPSRFHLTVSAALYLRATGDASKEPLITDATATITDRSTGRVLTTLNLLWSANLVPNQDKKKDLEGARTQVTAYSLKGGDGRSEELWFFPIDKSCGNVPPSKCTTSRANFVPWTDFLRSVLMADADKPANQTGYEVWFQFDYRHDGESGWQKVGCAVEISDTLRKMADPVINESQGVLYVSAPCRAIPSAKAARWWSASP